ncbi:MAG TPA: hypothetical protein VFB63_14855, partial [Bryobacteraceae bacterium]|nr:hypothetical protein [Bryobacteraceae bacterium]
MRLPLFALPWRSDFCRRLISVGLLGAVTTFGAVTARSVIAASLLPPGLEPTEIHVSRDLTHRYGEPLVLVNPRSPNILVIAAAATEFTYACKAANEQKCQIVTSGGFTQPYGIVNNLPGFTEVVIFVSLDRGKHWRRVHLPQRPSTHPDLAEPGHPTATVGPDGTFYIAWNATRFGARC